MKLEKLLTDLEISDKPINEIAPLLAAALPFLGRLAASHAAGAVAGKVMGGGETDPSSQVTPNDQAVLKQIDGLVKKLSAPAQQEFIKSIKG